MSNNQKLVEVKRSTSSIVLKNLIVMAVLVAIALTGVISWLTNKTTATADGINVECITPDGLEVAIVPHGADAPDDSEYKTGTITLDESEYPFLSDLSITEITSDGKTFYKPKLTQVDGLAIPDTDAEWDKASINDEYLSFDIYMRTKNTTTVYITSGTRVAPVSENLIGENAGNKSSDGDFSRDCVVGAVRMSFLNTCMTETNGRLLWIPAPNILFDSTKEDDKVSINESSGDSYRHYYWNVTESSKTKVEYDSAITNPKKDYTFGYKKTFALLERKNKGDEYMVGKTTVNLWIEGEDAEARLAMVGGKFNVTIKLSIQ